MSWNDLLLDIDGPVAHVRLNRPKTFNAMTVGLLCELDAVLTQLGKDRAVRVIVLSGEGKAFCAGADLASTLDDLPRGEDGKPDLGFLLERYYNPLLLRMRSLPQPIIAAVNGVAAGGGSSLALGADLTIAARSARFAQIFVNVALMPDVGGSWLLPQLLGRQRAMAAALLGETFGADRALELGLVFRVVDDAVLSDEAHALALQLANGPRTSIAAIKQAIHSAQDHTLEQQLQLEVELQRRCGQSPDFVEAASAFVAKRRPVFA